MTSSFILVGHSSHRLTLNDVRFKNLAVVKLRFIALWITHHYPLKSLLLCRKSFSFTTQLSDSKIPCERLFSLQFLFLLLRFSLMISHCFTKKYWLRRNSIAKSSIKLQTSVTTFGKFDNKGTTERVKTAINLFQML